jgi:ferredoxin
VTSTLRVNPIACGGHGACAELLPELIELDEWGYPIVDPQPIPPQLIKEARRAVATCPVLALKLIQQLRQLRARRDRDAVRPGLSLAAPSGNHQTPAGARRECS